MPRFTLPSGRSVDLRERPKTEQYTAILEAAERAQRGSSTWTAWAQTVGQQFVADDAFLDGWDDMDPDDTDAVCGEAQRLWREWQKQRRPKAPTSTSSPDTPEASPST